MSTAANKSEKDNLLQMPGPALRTRPVRVEDYLFNRETSQVEFFRRVLEEALDESQPLLERLKFLAIFSSNVDEFFMIRVSALKEALEEELEDVSPDGLTPAELMKMLRCRGEDEIWLSQDRVTQRLRGLSDSMTEAAAKAAHDVTIAELALDVSVKRKS